MTAPPLIDTSRHALFLDFDGTLVGLIDDPQAVRIEPAAFDRLVELQKQLNGALAIVSGRKIADLDRFLSPMRFAAVGVHGLERRPQPGAEVRRLMQPSALDPIRDALREGLEREPRLKLEDKGMALVLHYRTAPDLESEARRLMREAAADRDDMVTMNGDHIVEVHPAGMDKGRAVADLMTEPPFAGRRPIYAGDDVTDEFALAYVREAGGISVKIGRAESCAEYRLENVAAVHAWLGA
ncbi:trehalose-phosphatase [Consotaella salsifontis]|uniref:Trehalose 6-phosphate phosphatase n=1 Tax=Consotaella salsifontis TaxID=1365950 RepID=A0A1T4NJ42_9HYPH|nr:trehalose-phosphatase [Consotaella salsifontis]SJZ79341.1 trehalose 6-phosphatase [Consotaella salsifontis]